MGVWSLSSSSPTLDSHHLLLLPPPLLLHSRPSLLSSHRHLRSFASSSSFTLLAAHFASRSFVNPHEPTHTLAGFQSHNKPKRYALTGSWHSRAFVVLWSIPTLMLNTLSSTTSPSIHSLSTLTPTSHHRCHCSFWTREYPLLQP